MPVEERHPRRLHHPGRRDRAAIPYVTHRHPAVWEAPEVFDPDRFTPARAAARPTLAYFPFGGGPRHCIGSAFATTEMQLIVAACGRSATGSRWYAACRCPAAGLTLRPSPALPSRLERLWAG